MEHFQLLFDFQRGPSKKALGTKRALIEVIRGSWREGDVVRETIDREREVGRRVNGLSVVMESNEVHAVYHSRVGGRYRNLAASVARFFGFDSAGELTQNPPMDPLLPSLIVVLIVLLIAERLQRVVAAGPTFDATPDRPIAFGWKVYWIAFPCDDIDEACDALARADSRFSRSEFIPVNWKSGTERIFENNRSEVFITPPVNGWVMVLNWPTGTDEFEQFRSVLEPLSKEFDIAAGFGSHRVVSLVSWALAKNGELVRCFGQADFETFCDYGEKPPEEVELNLLTAAELEAMPESSDEDYDRVADETSVTDLAGAWTIDPSTLGEIQEVGVGRWAKFKG